MQPENNHGNKWQNHRKSVIMAEITDFLWFYTRFHLHSEMLSERDRDNYFFVGIKPLMLHNQIQNILERDSKWKDVTVPPEMNVVMDSTEQYLKRDWYVPWDLGDDEAPALGSYNADDDSSSSDSDLDEGKDSHRYWTKKDTTSKDKDKEMLVKIQTKLMIVLSKKLLQRI